MKGAANPVLKLALHLLVMEFLVVHERRVVFSSTEVFSSTVEVLSPPLFDASFFGGDKGGNSECDVHRKVITPNKLLPPPAGCYCFSCWGVNKNRHEIMRGKFLGDGAGVSIAVQVRTEGAGDFVVGVRRGRVLILQPDIAA
eukprot:14420798-Ditylum_brightwellii.AAC.1